MLKPAAEQTRVAMFCDGARRSGVLRYTVELAAQLTEAGIETTILTLDPETAAARQNVAELGRVASDVISLPQVENSAARAQQISQTIARLGPDVFIPNYRETTYAAAASLPDDCPTRILGICHNDHDSYYDLLARFEPVLDAVVAPTRKVQSELEQRLADDCVPLECISHGIPASSHRAKYTEDIPVRLIYHGRLNEPQKSTSTLLELAVELVRRRVIFELHLIGDVDDGADYDALVQQRGLQARVRIRTSVPATELPAILADCQIAVLTSRYEGFCLSLAEGMAVGLPAVAMRCGGVIEEYVVDDHNGFLVPWGDIAAMADRIQRLASDRQTWNRLSHAAHQTIACDYSLQQFGQRYRELIARMIERPARHAWPRLRPIVADRQQQPVRDLMDRVGQRLRMW